MIIWHNGTFEQDSDFRITHTDRGLTLGDGVFDTMLAIDGKPVWHDEHLDRLLHNAAAMKLGVAQSRDELKNIAAQLLQKNEFTQGRHAIRTTITRGPGIRGLAPPEDAKPTIMMAASVAPDPESLPQVSAVVTGVRNENSPLSRIKSLSYGDNIVALMAAQEKGGNEAILTNSKGNVCCTTAGNIFLCENGTMMTPPIEDGVLNGVTRLKLCEHYDVKEESFTPEKLLIADTVFLTNSIVGIRPVQKINGKELKVDRALIPDITPEALAA